MNTPTPQPSTRPPGLTLALQTPAQALSIVAGWILAAMASVAFGDVLTRMLGMPVTGAFELTTLLLGLTIYATLPIVTWEDGHVRAGVLELWRSAPPSLAGRLLLLRRALVLFSMGYLAWAMLSYMWRVHEAGDRAPFIEVPLAWVAGFGALCMAISAVLALWGAAAHNAQESNT